MPTRARIDCRLLCVRFLLTMWAATVCLLARAATLEEDFMIAVANDRAGQVKELLARGVDPNAVDQNGDPALVVAARAVTSVRWTRCWPGARMSMREQVRNTAIMAAALSGNLAIVRTLRARGAGLENSGWTPLIYAATGGHDAIVGYLLAEGANINAPSPNGTTALMMAVREGKGSTVELLIAKGADVNRRNQNAASALDWAVRGNEKKMAEQLRRAGAKE
jgi:ankyrin repeat protein